MTGSSFSRRQCRFHRNPPKFIEPTGKHQDSRSVFPPCSYQHDLFLPILSVTHFDSESPLLCYPPNHQQQMCHIQLLGKSDLRSSPIKNSLENHVYVEPSLPQVSRPYINRQADLTQWVKKFYGHIDGPRCVAKSAQFHPTLGKQRERSSARRGRVPEPGSTITSTNGQFVRFM